MLRLLVTLAVACTLLGACDAPKPASTEPVSSEAVTSSADDASADLSNQYPQVVGRLTVHASNASSVSAADLFKKYKLELTDGDLGAEAFAGCRIVGWEIEIVEYCCGAKCARTCFKKNRTPIYDCVEPCKPGKPCSVEPQSAPQ